MVRLISLKKGFINMRYTIVKGLNDDIYLDLGTNVSIICKVMDIGKALDALTYEVTVNGNELISFLKLFNLTEALKADIKPENQYVITAYDW